LNARYRRFLRSCARYTTSSETLDEGLITRSALDLRALLEFHPSGPYPTAGIPWYAVPFGRDGLISAYQTLGWHPDIARGTLRLLARHQGHEVGEFTEEEPGKIFHELRRGELARLGEVPHHPYYGSVDSTPLFAMVFAETVKWTADRVLWRDLLPHAERALTWCDTYGDPDKDGYVEYGHHPGVTSSAGDALWCGIASPERGATRTRRLMELDMYTGWGIRTLSSKYPTYNPMSYHNGSVWPHGNSLIVQGFARYGHREEAAEV